MHTLYERLIPNKELLGALRPRADIRAAHLEGQKETDPGSLADVVAFVEFSSGSNASRYSDAHPGGNLGPKQPKLLA